MKVSIVKMSFTALAALAALTLAACGSDEVKTDKVSFDAKPVIADIADNVIVDTYADLNTEAQALKTVITDMAQDGAATANELAAAQAQWKTTRAQWESSEGFLFGPVAARSIDPQMDTWPASVTDLENALANGNTSVADVEAANDNVRGFHAMEYLLFGDGVNDNNRNPAQVLAAELDYLVSLVTVLQANTQELEEAWTTQHDPQDPNSGGYVVQVKNPGSGSTYSSHGAVMEELINGILGIADEVGNGKIATPFGSDISQADDTNVESKFSWNSITDFHHNVQSILNVYTGTVDFDPTQDTVSTSSGVYAFVYAHDAALADRLYDEIVAAYDAVALMDGDNDASTTGITSTSTQVQFRKGISEPAIRPLIQDAIDKLATVQETLDTEVLPLLSKTDFAE